MHPFFAEVAKALSTVIRAKGYSLIVSSSEEDPELERQEIRQLLARRLDCLAIASSGSSIELFQRMDSQEQPYVLIDREFPELEANFVGIDDTSAGRIAFEHLFAHRLQSVWRILGGGITVRGFVALRGTGRRWRTGAFRLSRSMLSAECMRIRRVWSRERRRCGCCWIGTRGRMQYLPYPSAKIGAMNTILDAGLKIPEDIALIGCGNLHYDDCLRVGLSSIDQHSEKIGQYAAEIILALIESKERPAPRTVILEPVLIVRGSTGRSKA